MFSTISKYLRKRKVKTTLALMTSPTGEYDFDPETLRKVFETLEGSILYENDGIDLNYATVSFHHSPDFLVDKLLEANMAISEAVEFEHYGRLSKYSEFQFRNWLVNDQGDRLDYYEFIGAIKAAVSVNVYELAEVKEKVNKTRYKVYLDLLYTIHCDCLTLAELHLRKYG